MTDEHLKTTDSVEAIVGTDQPDGDDMCDYCRLPLEEVGTRTIGDTTYAVKKCPFNATHTKMLQI